MGDSDDIDSGFLYKLSKDKFLSEFECVLLIGALEDKYSPYESSLMIEGELIQNLNLKKKGFIQEMLRNLYENLKQTTLIRLFVGFRDLLKMDLDHFIGKKAHVEFLTNDLLLQCIVSRYDIFLKN